LKSLVSISAIAPSTIVRRSRTSVTDFRSIAVKFVVDRKREIISDGLAAEAGADREADLATEPTGACDAGPALLTRCRFDGIGLLATSADGSDCRFFLRSFFFGKSPTSSADGSATASSRGGIAGMFSNGDGGGAHTFVGASSEGAGAEIGSEALADGSADAWPGSTPVRSVASGSADSASSDPTAVAGTSHGKAGSCTSSSVSLNLIVHLPSRAMGTANAGCPFSPTRRRSAAQLSCGTQPSSDS
jgi:hypothetical protein